MQQLISYVDQLNQDQKCCLYRVGHLLTRIQCLARSFDRLGTMQVFVASTFYMTVFSFLLNQGDLPRVAPDAIYGALLRVPELLRQPDLQRLPQADRQDQYQRNPQLHLVSSKKIKLSQIIIISKSLICVVPKHSINMLGSCLLLLHFIL